MNNSNKRRHKSLIKLIKWISQPDGVTLLFACHFIKLDFSSLAFKTVKFPTHFHQYLKPQKTAFISPSREGQDRNSQIIHIYAIQPHIS